MTIQSVRSVFLLGIFSPLLLIAQSAPPLSVSATREAGTIRIDLIGDSTQTDNAGYGRGFCANLAPAVECLNFARGGQSTKSFRADGIWKKALASKPDYMLIQFGHNDETSGVPVGNQSTVAQYQQNLRNFVAEARAQKITPILVTPLTRRRWGKDGKIHSDLTAYSNGMEEVAKELQVPLIDLQARSIAYLDEVGKEKGNELAITKKDNTGKVQLDGTHLNWAGSYVFGRIVAEDLGKAVPALAQYVKPTPATLPPEGVLAMKVIQGAPFKIVMVGDSSISTTGGWGAGFRATLTPNVAFVDLGLAGSTAKNYIEGGVWSKALAAKGQFYFIQFGNDAVERGHDESAVLLKKSLDQMVRETREARAIPILISPLCMRVYRDGKLAADDAMSEYADTARDVATQDRVTFVDLYQMSRQYLGGQTQAAANALYVTVPGGKFPDRVSLSEAGSALFGRLVADNVIRTEVELGPNVNGLPEGAGPAMPKQAAPTDGH